MADIIYQSAKSIAQAIQDRDVSAVEVVQAHLDRIDEVNDRLNAVVKLCADRALEEAREADAALARGESKGALHGVPMTLKDSLDTEGVVTTYATLGRRTTVPERDSTVAARLRGAGAILLGKTNTPEFTLAGETDNLVYGRTNNPYGLDRTPGGSSGGAGAIVATVGRRSTLAATQEAVSGFRRTSTELPESSQTQGAFRAPVMPSHTEWARLMPTRRTARWRGSWRTSCSRSRSIRAGLGGPRNRTDAAWRSSGRGPRLAANRLLHWCGWLQGAHPKRR